MFDFLKNHPFAVEAFFDSSVVLTFAVPKQELQHLIPECLTLDTFQDQWGFVALAMVQTRDLRPKGFPAFMGNDFFLIGYRVFVRYTTATGKKLRGLFILRSETNKRSMEWLGNIFTKYSYTTTDISEQHNGATTTILSEGSGLHVEYRDDEIDIALPVNSPFADWKEARKFAGPMPFTFSYGEKTGKVLMIEGVRQNWQPQPISVMKYESGFLNSLDIKGSILANAFIIKQVPYYWKKGKTELWPQ